MNIILMLIFFLKLLIRIISKTISLKTSSGFSLNLIIGLFEKIP